MALYVLGISLKEAREISVGKRKKEIFPLGLYLYVGQAKRNLTARLQRHLRREKKKHWHIDFLLEYADIVGIALFREEAECFLAQCFMGLPEIRGFIPRFGASDCRCLTHLFLLGERYTFPDVFASLERVFHLSPGQVWYGEGGVIGEGVFASFVRCGRHSPGNSC